MRHVSIRPADDAEIFRHCLRSRLVYSHTLSVSELQLTDTIARYGSRNTVHYSDDSIIYFSYPKFLLTHWCFTLKGTMTVCSRTILKLHDTRTHKSKKRLTNLNCLVFASKEITFQAFIIGFILQH